MLLLLFVVIIQMSVKNNVDAQKFRDEYMWAQAFKTFYRLHDLATNWDHARQVCEAEGTELLVPVSLDEIENLKVLMSNMKARHTAMFIGIHDKFSNGNYVTLKGDPITGTLLDLIWGQGSPKNINDTDHCVIMTREGLLDDRNCTDMYPFVCRILGDNIRYNAKCDSYDLAYTDQNNGKCYKIHAEPLSWHDAYMICKAESGQLAIINSPEEATLITNLFSKHLECNAPNPNILHIGFSDLMFPYQYRTILDQTLEEAGYSLMNSAHEDVSVMEGKRCGSLTRTGFLEMTCCDQAAMYICEKLINNTEV